jgi:nicotinamidase-related amidase
MAQNASPSPLHYTQYNWRKIMKTAFKYNRLDKNDVAVLLVDHQSGLTNCVQNFSPDDFKNNVLALADVTSYFNLPTILTTSFEDDPNGSLVPELKVLFPNAQARRALLR